jgi:dTDP-4-amino-4,6-dideoxygalactose transaminase
VKDKPAILGGKPIVQEPIPIARPTLPDIHNISDGLNRIYTSGMITNSYYVREFEKNVADYLGVKEAVCVANCTSGLILVLRALELTGEIILPSFTFFATAHALLWNNITPVFVDCDPETYNINIEAIPRYITSHTCGIMAVHMFGNPVDISGLHDIATKYNLKIIIDSAHAFGTKYRGRLVGGFGIAEVFCLSPTKILTAVEGGIITTNDHNLARKLRIGRDYGNPGNYDCELLGLSARMEEFNALIGIKALDNIETLIQKRTRLAEIYYANLKHLPGISFQRIHPEDRSSYKDFSIIVDDKEFGLSRDQLSVALAAEGIDTRKYFSPPLHQQKLYSNYIKHSLPVTEYVSSHILCLPIYSHMEEIQVENICNAIHRIHRYHREIQMKLTTS